MKIVGVLLRIFSYLFHFFLSLFLLGIALVATVSHQPLNLRMLPFDDDKVLVGVYLLAGAGLLATLLALTRTLKFIFPLWAAVVLYLLIRGYFFSAYSFHGVSDFKNTLWFIGAALMALIGAIWTLKPRRGRLYS